MAASPPWKVYDQTGRYLASTKDAFLAAGLIAAMGTDGWTIRHGHSAICYTEGKDGHASESIDQVAEFAASSVLSRNDESR